MSSRTTLPVLALVLAVLTGGARAQAPPPVPGDQRPGDRDAIRAHILSIFDAFDRKDREKVRSTHAKEWRGFLTYTPNVLRGIEAYMQDAEYGLTGPPEKVSWDLSDFDVLFYGDVAVVNFVADVVASGRPPHHVFRIMDIYTKQQDGSWIQSASHTVRHPADVEERMSRSVDLDDAARNKLLADREAVWRAWFANDRGKLEALIPDDSIALGPGNGPWEDRAAIFEGSRSFAAEGGKLVRLEFPKTEIRAYGSTAILYTTYIFETKSASGERNVTEGRATEIFVLRHGTWVNPGWHLDTVH